MDKIEWKIEDGRLWVERTGEGYRAWWDAATADEAATILRSAIEAEREACAKVADAHVAEHDARFDYPSGVKPALQLEGRAIASAIRARSSEREG